MSRVPHYYHVYRFLYLVILLGLVGCTAAPVAREDGRLPDEPWRTLSPALLQALAYKVGDVVPTSVLIFRDDDAETPAYTLRGAEGIAKDGRTFSGGYENLRVRQSDRDLRDEYAAVRAEYERITLGPQELYQIAQTVYPQPLSAARVAPVTFDLRIDLRNLYKKEYSPTWVIAFSSSTHYYTIAVDARSGAILRQEEDPK